MKTRAYVPWPEPDEGPPLCSSSSSSGATSLELGGSPAAPPPAEEDLHFLAYHKRDPYLLLHKAFYFTSCAALAAYVPYLVQWMESIGFTSLEAGGVFATGQLTGILASPLLSRLADTSGAMRRGLFVGALGGQIVALLVMETCTSYGAVTGCFVACEVCTVVIFPMLDSSIQRLLTVVHGDAKWYGNTRAWGAAGWGVFGWVFGALYDHAGGPPTQLFRFFAYAQAPCLLLALLLPMERRAATTQSDRTALTALLRWPVLAISLVFVLCSLLLTSLDLYRFSYLQTKGATNQLMGLSLLAASLSEAPFFFFTGTILRRLGVGRALVVVGLAYAARYLWYALLTDPRYTVPAELLHGLSFALGWAAATEYVGGLLPPELASTGQGLLSAVVWGVGGALGSLYGGGMVLEFGWQAMWLTGAALGCVAAAIMGVTLVAFPRDTK